MSKMEGNQKSFCSLFSLKYSQCIPCGGELFLVIKARSRTKAILLSIVEQNMDFAYSSLHTFLLNVFATIEEQAYCIIGLI